jgi:hypothetical protein
MKEKAYTVVRATIVTLLLSVALLGAGQAGAAYYPLVSDGGEHDVVEFCLRVWTIPEITHEYRMFYDEAYASAERLRLATNEYRNIYDQAFAAARSREAASGRMIVPC